MGRPNTLGRGPHHEYGARIKKAFDKAGYGGATLQQIGDLIGLQGSQVGKIFNGWRTTDPDKLALIAKLTNTSFEWLATGRGEMMFSLTGGTIDISHLSPEAQEKARNIMKEIIKNLE